jgi:hypothetical protein
MHGTTTAAPQPSAQSRKRRIALRLQLAATAPPASLRLSLLRDALNARTVWSINRLRI